MFPPNTQRKRNSRRKRSQLYSLTRKFLIIAAVSGMALLSVYVTFAAISLSTSVPYNQSFDGMGVPGSNPSVALLPTDFRIATPGAVRTVGSFTSATSQTNFAAGANMATNASNGTYNFGAGTTTLGGSDRAVGFISSAGSTLSGNLYAEFINNTGDQLSALQVSYAVEKYRKGSNPSGFRVQLFYSSNGISWTNAGPNFMSAFGPDLDNTGFATAPGATSPISSTLNVPVADKAKIYLAWNYSVTSGTTTSNAQALAVDNISILGIAPGQPTNPTGVGTATPPAPGQTQSTLLTVSVTPGTNPTSAVHAVSANLSAIGGSAAQQFFDDGSNGDVTPNDNVFSFATTVALGTSLGGKILPFTVTETSPLGRTASGAITLTVTPPTNPTAVGAATPSSLLNGQSTKITVTVTPGMFPTSTNLAVTADLSPIGNGFTQLFDNGIDGGDLVANDNVFTAITTIPANLAPGPRTCSFSVSDAQGRTAAGTFGITVQAPPPPVDHVVISQVYGGGGNSGATYQNDYVELYNPTGLSFNLAGWSLQYASAAGSSWINKQPLGGTIAPGEYLLVSLGSGGANGVALPAANISGDLNLSATTGKVALVNNSVNLSGACPVSVDPDIVDFVGYGASATCFEGAAVAPAPSNTTAILRKVDGLQDTNQNNADFETATPNPRRTAPIVELGPWVSNTEPIADGTNAPYDSTISIDFSEPVDVNGTWWSINCTASGPHTDATVASYNGSKGYHVNPNVSFQFGEQCTVTVFAAGVQDQDLDDSGPGTNNLFADYSWTFTVVGAGAPAPYPANIHLAMGNPSGAVSDQQEFNNYLMEKPSFALSYNRDKGTPNWVSWHLDPAWFGNLQRVDTFRADPAVQPAWYRVQSTDYSNSGFDRGHMTPNADRDNENRIPINQETYLMSNMVPQAPDNNQGPWANMENALRAILTANGENNEMYVIAGPAGVGGTNDSGVVNTIANGHVTVPAFTWKVVMVLPSGVNDISRVTAATRTIAVIMPNTQGIRTSNPNDWQSYLTTVDAVEALTGYDFFANVPDAIENAIEGGVNGNNPPGAEHQFATTPEDTAANISLDVAIPSGSSVTYVVDSQPAHGVLSGSGPTFTYTPGLDYHGADSFTFHANDGTRNSNTATVSITVTEVNDSPAANDDTATTDEDSAVNVSAIDLAANDNAGPADESLQNLAVTNVTATANTHGTAVLNNGTVTYTPDANYHGAASFTYTVCDNGTTNGASDPQCTNGTVNVTVNSINDDPVAADDTATTNEDTPVSVDVVANDTDLDGDGRTLQSVGTAAHGTVTIVAGQVHYSPEPDYNGTDSFSYVVSDGHGGTATGNVSLTINPVNDDPVAVANSATTEEDTPFTLDVVANDTDADGDSRTLQSVGSADHGSLTVVSGQVHYIPAPNFNGADSFTYLISDGHGGTATGTVNVTVTPVNDDPVAADNSTTTNEDTTVMVDVVANDTDIDGDVPALQSVGTAAHGSVSVVNGQAQYTPNANFNGTDSFSYVVSDGHGGTASATVNVTISPINDAPSAGGQAVSTNSNTAVGISLTGSDFETALANLNFTITVNPAHGTISGTGANRSYTPAPNYTGPDSFKFTTIDSGDGADAALTSSEATVSITVNDTVNPTMAAPSNLSLETGAGATSCRLFISDSALGTANAEDNSGVVSIQRTGVPSGNIFPVGTTIITYIATDGSGNTAQTTQTVTVADNTPPTFAAPTPVTVSADSSGHAPVPNFVAGLVGQDNCGTVTLSQNPTAGTIVGVGTHTITITGQDQAGNTSTQTTTFTVQSSGGALIFSLDAAPGQAKRGKSVKLTAIYSNDTGATKVVTFTIRYDSPCGSFTIGNIGPIPIANGAHGRATLPFVVPLTACTGLYTLTLETYVDGAMVGSTTATLNVTK
jgi:DNA/RNA endonuclease G (NUC1)